MASNPTIRIAILGDARNAKRAFKDTEVAAAKMGRGIGKVGVAAGVALGGIALAGLRALGTQVTDAFKGAIEAEKVTKVLTNQVKNLGVEGQKAFANSERFALQLGNSIGVDDDDVKAVLAKLASFPDAFRKGSLGAEAMERATKAAFDLQAIGIGSAESNIIGIGKALNDPIKGMTALSKSGVSFTAEQKEQIKKYVKQGKLLDAQKVLLAGIESNAKGAALAAVSPMDKLKVTLKNMAEALAGKLLPYANKLATWVSDRVIPALEKLWDVHGPKVIETFKRIGRFLKETLQKASGPLRDFATSIADFAKSEKGQKLVGDFLDFFKAIDVDKMIKIVGQAVILGGIFKVGSAVGKHPILTLLGLLAATYPEETQKIIGAISDSLGGVMAFAARHPGAVTALVALLAAYKGLSVLRGLKLPNLFSGASQAAGIQSTAGTKMVTAANKQAIAATQMLAAANKIPTVPAGGVVPADTSKGGKLTTALKRTFILGEIVFTVALLWEILPDSWQQKIKKFWVDAVENSALGQLAYQAGLNDWLGKVERFFSHTVPGVFLEGTEAGWSGFWTATVEELNKLKRWFSHTLPDAINLGEGTGWSGLWDDMWNLGRDLISGLGAGMDSLTGWIADRVGSVGSRVPGWMRAALLAFSPSRKMADVGRDVMRGLVAGIKHQTPKLERAIGGVTATITGLSASPEVSLGGLGHVAVTGAVAGTGASYSITVNVSPTSDQAEVGRSIITAIEAAERRNGRRRLLTVS